MPRLFRLIRNQDGIAAVEFAFVAPIMALILSGIIETSLIMYASAVMEGATTISSRLGKTGYTQSGTTRQDLIYNMIKDRCGLLIDMNKVSITTLTYKSFGDIGDPEPYTDSNHNGSKDSSEAYSDTNGNGQWDSDMGVAGLGGADDIVLYKVTYPWSVLTPLMRPFIGGGTGTYTIRSNVLVKNEPYNVVQGR